MRFLRTNTAIRLTVGPFLDKTDGVTPETAITVTNEKLTFVVDDANVPTLVLDTAPTASGGSNDMVHITGDDAGFYDLELAAANVNYLGRAMLSLTDSTVHCPVFHEFMILPAMVYDSLVLGTDRFDTNVTHVADTAQTAGDIPARLPAALGANGNIKADVRDYNGAAGTFASGRPEVNTTHWKGTAAATADTAGYPVVTVKDGTGAGEIALTSGAVDTVTTLTNAPSDSSGVTTLLSRLSALRAGYLDNLSAGAVALEATAQSILSKLLKYVQLILRKDSAIATDNATELTAINANGGSGAGAYANTTDANEALRDRGDAAWTTATGFSTHTAADVWAVATRLLTAGTNIVLAKGTGVTGFNDLSASQVNAEVVDALATDTYAEPGQGAPAATASLAAKINYLYKSWRNKKTQTSTTRSLYADDGSTVDQKATDSDDATTYTKGEIGSGP